MIAIEVAFSTVQRNERNSHCTVVFFPPICIQNRCCISIIQNRLKKPSVLVLHCQGYFSYIQLWFLLFVRRRYRRRESGGFLCQELLEKMGVSLCQSCQLASTKEFLKCVNHCVKCAEQFSKRHFLGQGGGGKRLANHVEVLTIFESLMIMYLIVAFYYSLPPTGASSRTSFTLGRRSDKPTKIDLLSMDAL